MDKFKEFYMQAMADDSVRAEIDTEKNEIYLAGYNYPAFFFQRR